MSEAKKRKLNCRKVSSEEADRRIDAFINSMDLMTAVECDGVQSEAYKPADIFNPGYQRVYQCISYRAINPSDQTLPPINPSFVAGVLPIPELIEAAKDDFVKVKDAFKITKVEVKVKSNEKFQQNLAQAALKEFQLLEQEEGKASGLLSSTETGSSSTAPSNGVSVTTISGLSGMLVSSVGPNTPVEDFKAILARRDIDLVSSAVTQMCSTIVELATTSFGAQFHDKIINCLKALRQGCIAHVQSRQYNEWLRGEFRSLMLGEGSCGRGGGYQLWESLKQIGGEVGLITKAEAGESEVSAEEAVAFFENEEPQKQKNDLLAIEHADDVDMLEMLE